MNTFNLIARSFFFFITLLLVTTTHAQRKRGELSITPEQVRQITEIVKPITEQLSKRFSGDETYRAYEQDIRRLNETRSFEEKSALSKQINEKYSDYFAGIWKEANVDERSYQLRITRLFAEDVASAIQFYPLLVFTLQVSVYTPPPPAELPPDKCVDVCSMTKGEITGSGALIAGSGGLYGNCFLRTNAWSAVVGGNTIYGYLRNGITIPGTFPNDARKLRVVKSWEFMQEATTFALIGGGYAETSSKTYSTSEYMLVYSPVIFGRYEFKLKSMSENYLIDKANVAQSLFRGFSTTFSALISGNWSSSHCYGIKWTVCEER